jgi:phosphoheptose isomerase
MGIKNQIQTWNEQIESAKMDKAKTMIKKWIRESIKIKEDLWGAGWMQGEIYRAADCIVTAFTDGRKLLVCGNGGSASDSAHFCGEFNNQLSSKCPNPLPAIDLSAMNATITAIGNDYGYGLIFEKQVKALGRPGDVLLGISTSGNSKNVLHAIRTAKKIGLKTILLTGKYKPVLFRAEVNESGQTAIDSLAPDILINVHDVRTSLIQESHIMILHIIVNLVDSIMFGVDYLED